MGSEMCIRDSDLYDIVTGHVRTTQIYGVPLMELTPELMPAWQRTVKRLIDVVVAVVVLAGLAPLWLLVAAAIKLTSKGPVFFRQERVGEGDGLLRCSNFARCTRMPRRKPARCGPRVQIHG